MATVKLEVVGYNLPSIGYLHTPPEDRALCDSPYKGLRDEILDAVNAVLRAYELDPVRRGGQ